jgi:hypothetical protein
MNHTSQERPPLPEGWYYPDADTALRLDEELQRELPQGHPLYGVAVRAFAWRQGASDDVLFQHERQPERFTEIHLTWVGKTEINEEHPSVIFDGQFYEWVGEEGHLYGLKLPSDTP